jgi:hypothetical protein
MKNFFALIIMVSLVACSEPETIEPKSQTQRIEYTVTTASGDCVSSGFVVIAVVDADDKFERSTSFDCNTATDHTELSSGDTLEIRMYSNGGSFDKSLKYNITVTQNVTNVFKGVDYTGIKYIVR